MTNLFRPMIAGAAILALPVIAQAQSFPRTVAQGDSLVVEYGPAPRGNVVGGGAVAVTPGNEQHIIIRHLEPDFAQQRTDGRVPVLAGSGEDARIEWVIAPRPGRAG